VQNVNKEFVIVQNKDKLDKTSHISSKNCRFVNANENPTHTHWPIRAAPT